MALFDDDTSTDSPFTKKVRSAAKTFGSLPNGGDSEQSTGVGGTQATTANAKKLAEAAMAGGPVAALVEALKGGAEATTANAAKLRRKKVTVGQPQTLGKQFNSLPTDY